MGNKINVMLTGVSVDSDNKGINALTIGSIISLFGNNSNVHIELFNQSGSCDQTKKHLIDINGKNVEIIENVVWGVKFDICGLLHTVFSFFPQKIKKFLFIDCLYFFIAVPMLIKRKSIDTRNVALNKLIKADFVINLAEGDSFSDIYGLRAFFRQSVDKIIALAYSRKTIIFPQTIGPFDAKIAQRITKNIFRKVDKIYVRENQSKRYLNKLFGELPNMQEANDMAFLMNSSEVVDKEFNDFVKDSIVVGVNVSGFLYNHPVGRDKILGADMSYKQIMIDIIDKLFELEENVKVVLFSHVKNEDYKSCVDVRDIFIKKGQRDRIFLLSDNYSAQQIKFLISKMSFFTGARMHACIGALSMSVPTVPLAYSYKFLGITDKLGLGEYVVDLRKDERAQMLAKLEKGFQNRLEIKNHLNSILPDVKSKAYSCGCLSNYK